MDEVRVHEAVQRLVETFRIIPAGTSYPMELVAYPTWLKVRLRRPRGLKMGACVPVMNANIGRAAAQQFATMLQLAIQAQMASLSSSVDFTVGSITEWEDFTPEVPIPLLAVEA